MSREKALTIYWRGALSSCNYACGYCPFAKTKNTRAELDHDKAALTRFSNWTAQRDHPLEIMITPWGEALIRKYYRDAMTRWAHQSNIDTIAIQTNLSCSLEWLNDCDLSRLAFWTTFHPGETPLETFTAKIAALEDRGARYSVGIVGTTQSAQVIEALRAALPDAAYLWVNADRSWSVQDQMTSGAYDLFSSIDPLFTLNTRSYPSQGMFCRAGRDSILVGWDGTASMCHFVEARIGNIYDADFDTHLQRRRCPAKTCDCHIGYSNLDALDMQGLYDGFLERRIRPGVGPGDAAQSLAKFQRARR